MTQADWNRVYALRAQLHATPELSGRETETMNAIEAFLKANTALRVEHMDGWLLATHWEGDGLPEIGFRADMDALPDGRGGARHGCGHDGHSAILCGLALALEGRQVGKNIRLIFQPAEETGEGAKCICKTWHGLRRLRRIYGLHNIPGWPVGRVLLRRGCFSCASRGLVVQVQGRPAHAAYPGDGANPAPLLCGLVQALPGMVEGILSGDARLLMFTVIGLQIGGEDFGMSASEGRLCLTLRGHRQADIDALEARIRETVRAGCDSQGMACAFEHRDPFPDTTVDDTAFSEALERFRCAGIAVQWLDTPMRWSEDFGWYLKSVPGVFFGIGAGVDCPGLHTEGYAFDDDAIAPAVAAFAALAGL